METHLKIENLELLEGIVRSAGEIALSYYGHNPSVSYKKDVSPVTEADLAVDFFLKKKLLAARPKYGWISEESNDLRQKKTYSFYFLVDPIDGTRGFINRNDRWCISVGVVNTHTRQPVISVLFCPALDEFYTAVEGKGVCLNKKILSKSDFTETEANLKVLRISCSKKIKEKIILEKKEQVIFDTKTPSVAYRIISMIRDECDAVLIHHNCKDWDLAAVDLILSEMGGGIYTLNGEKIQYLLEKQHELLIATKISYLNRMIDWVKQKKLNIQG